MVSAVKWIGIMGCIILAAGSLPAQGLFEFNDPQELPFNVNSDAPEILPILAPNGNQLYFSRSLYDLNTGGKYAGHDIWMSERTSSGWTRAEQMEFPFNTKGNDALVGVNRQGDRAFIMRTFPNKKIPGIYYVQKAKGEWGDEKLIAVENLSTQGSLGFYMHPDEDVLLISMKAADSQGEEDIYISVKGSNGVWSPATNLGTTINTSGYEISPFLSDDKRSLYFSSNGHKGLGDADIFVSYRLYDSWETWTVPRNLGEKINSKKFDAYFSLVGDTLAYFSSNKGGRFTDVYSSRVTHAGPERNVIPLAEAEIDSLIGKNVARKVEFNERSTALNANQRELLWYIATKLISQKDVRIMLVPSKEDDQDLTSNRLNSIIAQLAGAGIEGSRIKKPTEPVSQIYAQNTPPSRGEVHLVLIR